MAAQSPRHDDGGGGGRGSGGGGGGSWEAVAARLDDDESLFASGESDIDGAEEPSVEVAWSSVAVAIAGEEESGTRRAADEDVFEVRTERQKRRGRPRKHVAEALAFVKVPQDLWRCSAAIVEEEQPMRTVLALEERLPAWMGNRDDCALGTWKLPEAA